MQLLSRSYEVGNALLFNPSADATDDHLVVANAQLLANPLASIEVWLEAIEVDSVSHRAGLSFSKESAHGPSVVFVLVELKVGSPPRDCLYSIHEALSRPRVVFADPEPMTGIDNDRHTDRAADYPTKNPSL